MKNKTEYTPSEALQCLDDVSRNAFYNDMQSGNISYEKKQWGKKERRFIAGAELARFYAGKFHPERLEGMLQDIPEKQPATLQDDIKTRLENNSLQPVVDILKEQLKNRDSLIEDLSGKLDKAYDTIHRQTLLLTDNRPEKPIERRKRFFDTLLSKKWLLRS